MASSNPSRRLRVPKNFPRPGSGEFPYGRRRAEIARWRDGEIVGALLASDAWRECALPVLQRFDEYRRPRTGQLLYTAQELESVLLWGALKGYVLRRDTRAWLAGDTERRTRAVLGFDRPRNEGRKDPDRLDDRLDGVPSEATLSRYCTGIGVETRLAMYLALYRRLLDEHFQFPEMVEESRTLYLDGSRMTNRWTVPLRDPSGTGTISNADKVTCHDGGHMPARARPEEDGSDGYNGMFLLNRVAIPLAGAPEALGYTAEATAGEAVLADYGENVARYMPPDTLTVLVADSALNSRPLRALARTLGIAESIPLSSHGKGKRNKATARMRQTKRASIQGYDNWNANYHRELFCKCGRGRTAKRGYVANGVAHLRVEGQCDNCGPISITSGNWCDGQEMLPDGTSRLRFVRRDPRETRELDLTFGNPLTFNDPLAHKYGNQRWGQEAFNSTLTTRFAVLRPHNWYRTLSEADLALKMIFCLVHFIAIEQRRRRAQA
jgi:hypothetical protein